MSKQSDYLKRYKEDHVRRGLCVFCSKKAKKGHTMCQYHLNYQKFYSKMKKGGKTGPQV